MSTLHLLEGSHAVADAVAPVARRLDVRLRRYRDPEGLLAETGPESDGCLLIDIALTGPGGDLLHRLGRAGAPLPAVVYGPPTRLSVTAAAVRTGARVLDLPATPSEVHEVLAGALAADAIRRRDRQEAQSPSDRLGALTAEQKEVFRLLLMGVPNKAVALRLDLGLRTVERYRAVALGRLGVKTLVEAARVYATADAASFAKAAS